MTKEIKFTIDGQEIIAQEGQNILDAALANDIYIPHLCHHPDLKPVGACRLCGIEIDGGRMTMSCLETGTGRDRCPYQQPSDLPISQDCDGTADC